MKKTIRVLLCLCLALPAAIYAQTGSTYNQRDDQYRLLGLKRAKEAYDAARQSYERQQKLFEEQIVSETELEQARVRLKDAEVNYQQSLLAVLFEQQYITVASAVKYQTPDGAKRVRLTVANASGGSAEYRHLLPTEDELFRALQPDVVYGVYISLLDDTGAVISQPYEARIDRLAYGEPCQLDFLLLQDLDVVTVNMIYGKGTERKLKIFLQKDTSTDRVAVQSRQFSQEAELGKTASFDLTLELFSGAQTTFYLETVNLPQALTRVFKDQETQARLNQVKFTERASSQRAVLEVTLPDRPAEGVVVDQVIPFYALAVPAERLAGLPDLRTRRWTQEELQALGVGFVRLELVPRGTGRLLIRAPQLFHAIPPDGSVEMAMDLINEGSRPLANVRTEVDLPLNWTKTVTPALIPSLGIGDEQRVQLRFTPPTGTAAGRYEARIRTSGFSDTQPVNGEDKTVMIEIQPPSNLLGTVLLVTLILGLVAGMVVFGIRLSRR
jgi:hypothetical protein